MARKKKEKDRYHTKITFFGDKLPVDKIHHATLEKAQGYAQRVKNNADWNEIKSVQIIDRQEGMPDVVVMTIIEQGDK